MKRKATSQKTAHKLPADIKKIIASSATAKAAWLDITPLARNEWICWVESVKKPETRKKHLIRLGKELARGKRRPCCWAGCVHRKDKAICPSVRAILKI